MTVSAPTVGTIAASYERVSTMAQARYGFSLAAQHSSMDEFATAQGWQLPEHLRFRDGEDENASGADWDLPALNAMLAAARARAFSVLIVPDLDRFARTMVKGLVLEEQLKKYGVRVVYQRVPVEDTPEGRLLKNQLFSIAEYEREKFRLRSMIGKTQKAKSGQVVGGPRAPYGYRFVQKETRPGMWRIVGLDIDPETGPIVTRIFSLAVTRSSADVAAILNAEGIPSPSGRHWVHKAVWRILVNPVYTGTWLYGRAGRYDRRIEDKTAIAVTIPAIVGRTTWERVQAALLDRKVKKRRGQRPIEDDPYLLRGMLECGHCHNGLYSRDNGNIRYYTCGHSLPSRARAMGWQVCELPSVNAIALERELWIRLVATLLDPEYLAQGLQAAQAQNADGDRIRQDRMGTLEAEITRQRKRLDTLAGRMADLGDGELFSAALRQAKEAEGLIARLVQERDELAAVPAEGLSATEADAIEAFAEDIRAGILHATPAERRKLYELLQVRGRVYHDDSGRRLGRKHHYRIDWTAAIQLQHNAALINVTRLPYWFLDELKALGIEAIHCWPDEGHAVNCLAVRPGKVLISEGCPWTVERLNQRGVETVEIEYSEVRKNGGGIHCSTLPLIRDRM